MSYLRNFRYVEFLITYGCNYNCSYCFFVDRLKRDNYMFRQRGPGVARTPLQKWLYPKLVQMGIFQYSDAFLNYPLRQWQDLFRALFAGHNTYLSFTGGEPLLLWKQVFELIRSVVEVSKEWIIRFDTNATIAPPFPEEWKSHLSFNVSYHRQEVKDFPVFVKNLDRLAAGARSVMMNRVVHEESDIPIFLEELRFFKERGYFLNFAPAFFNLDGWSEEHRRIARSLIHPIDYQLKIDKATKGKHCLYPSFGFQLLPNGYAWVPPCDDKAINLMKTKDPTPLLYKGGMTCPADHCACLHQYSFVTENNVFARNKDSMDILGSYVRLQETHRSEAGEGALTSDAIRTAPAAAVAATPAVASD